MRLRSQTQKRSGAAVVEMAVVTPMIFLIAFASIEFGRVMMAIHGLEEAAREGCRMAILADASTTNIQTTVSDRLDSFGISGYSMKTNPADPNTACQWDPVTVDISVPYNGVSWLPAPRYLSGIFLKASCTLSRESDECI